MMSNVSVITPCHNAAAYLRDTLASVASQSLRPAEVIVIDDASSDGSAETARRVAGELGLPLTLLSVDVRNAAAARNAGLAAATGRWVAFLDADDVWYPQHLERALAVLSPSNDVAYMADHHWLRGGVVEPIPASLQPKVGPTAGGLSHLRFVEEATRGFHFGHSTVIYRRDRVNEVGGFDASQVRRHDIDLWLRVVAGQTWAWGGEPAARYRIDTPGSISKNVVEAQYYHLRALQRNAANYAGPAMESLIATCARHAMSLAFVDGTPSQYDQVRRLAWPHLTPAFRASYRVADLWNRPVQQAIRVKRAIRNRVRTAE